MPNRTETLLILPAFNEEASLAKLLPEIRAAEPELDILVVSDGSTDGTSALAHQNGCIVLDLPCNLGVGGAVQAGFAYAFQAGYRYAVRCDADGQHPPSEIRAVMEELRRGTADVVIGSRFLGSSACRSHWVRRLGIVALSRFLSVICRATVTDPTSGFQGVNRVAMNFFARCYPSEYPEPEALALLRRQGFAFREVGVRFRDRLAGISTIDGWGTLYFAFKVFLALCVDRARHVDSRLSRSALLERSLV